MPVKIFKSKIAYAEEIAESVHKLNIPLNEGETIEFQAGQFVNLLVAPGVRRSYSVASPPSYNTGVDLIADSVIGGPGSQFFANSKVGDEVEFLGP
ncbi:MAG TPA: FAD-binding oxidoreductase, partial [Candidatus Dojkabacteria bacterium]|nr:FAD-binding oxidoreductase [Candidatus Dojkabacteria bacterium]